MEVSLLNAAVENNKKGFLTALSQCARELKESPRILHVVCRNGWLDVAKELITDYNMDPDILKDIPNEIVRGATCLHFACISGNIELVEYLISVCCCNVYRHTNDDITVLHCAIIGGLHVLKHMVSLPNVAPMFSCNPSFLMRCAYYHWDNDLIKYLIVEHKCSIIINQRIGDTILHYACRDGHIERLQFLVTECKCDIHVINSKNGNTLLHTLCHSYDEPRTNRQSSLDILIFLVDKFKLENCRDSNVDGYSSFNYAIMSRWPKGVAMIWRKAYYNYHDLKFTSHILSLAYHHWDESIMKFFIVEVECTIITDKETGNSVLHEACKEMRLDKLKFLIHLRNFNLYSFPNTLLHAFSSSSIQPSKELLCYIKSNCTYSRNASNFTPLEWAICHPSANTLPMVRCLVEVYGTDELYTKRILHLMCKYWSNDLMKYLLVEMNYCLKNGPTAVISNACSTLCDNGEFTKHKFLVNECQVHIHDTNIKATTICYSHPKYNHDYRQCSSSSQELGGVECSLLELFYSAICHRSLSIIIFLFEKCHSNFQKFLLVHISRILDLAYSFWDDSTIKYLLLEVKSAKITPIVDNCSGDTILHKACQAKNISHVKFLVEMCDCNPHIANYKGETLIHIACRNFNYLQYLCIECNCCPDLTDQEVGTVAMKSAIAQKEKGLAVIQHLIEKCKVKSNYEIMLFVYEHWCPGIVKYLIVEANFDIYIDAENNTILHCALNQDHNRLKYLIDTCGCSPHVKSNDGETLIHTLTSQIDFAILQYLCIDCNCCPDLDDDQKIGTLAMKSAIAKKMRGLAIVKHLVQKCKVVGNCEIMSFVYEHWCPDIVKYLIVEAKFDAYIDSANNTILHLSALNQDHNRLKYLIDTCGCSPLVQSKDSETLIHAACHCYTYPYNFAILQYLCIDCNCCPDLTSADQKVATIAMKSAIAQEDKGLAVVKHFVEKCKVVENKEIMSYVYEYWCPNIVKYLIMEAKFDLAVSDSENILHYCAMNKKYEQLRFLFETCHLPITNEMATYIIQHMVPLSTYDSDVFYVLKHMFMDYKCIISVGCSTIVNLLNYCCVFKVDNLPAAVAIHFVKTFDDSEINTILHLLVSDFFEHFQCIVKYLIVEAKFNLAVSDSENILHYCAMNKKYKQLKFLFETCHLPITNEMATYIIQHMVPLSTYDSDVSNLLTYLFVDYKCIVSVGCSAIVNLLKYVYCADDLSAVAIHLVNTCTMSEDINSILRLLVSDYSLFKYSPEFLFFIEYLIYDCHCDVTSQDEDGNTVLHLACSHFIVDQSLIERIMSTGKADPFSCNKDDKTPLMLLSTTSLCTKIGKSKAEQIISRFGDVQIAHPIHLYVSIIFLGNPGVGKSTLTKVIRDRNKYSAITASFKKVKGVELHTAGIIPYVLNDKDIGRIILHDLAGQAEYYSSHTAVLENLLQGSAAVFVLVVSLADTNVIKSFHQWLNIIENVSHNALHQCHLIVVASHADQSGVNDLDQLKKSIRTNCSIKSTDQGSSIVKTNDELFTLDCRKPGGGQLVKFISALSTACKSITDSDTKKMSLYCHILYDFLQRDGKSVYTLHELAELSATKFNNGLFLPKDVSQLDKIISQLNATGLIVFLRNPLELTNSWIVANKAVLLSELNGVLFAPQDFKQHVSIASNTGVIKVSDLHSIFPKYDPKLLLEFLQYMKLCSVICSKFIIEELDCSTNVVTDQFIFIPTLIKSTKRPAKVDEILFKFGWRLCCLGTHSFLSRFLHLLQLRLTCKFSDLKSDSTFERYCKLWTKGVYWKDTKGVEALVEVVNSNQAVVVLMSCENGAKTDMLNLIHDVLAEILSCKQQVMPQVVTHEYIIDSSSLHGSLEPLDNIPLYRVHLLARCYINNKPYILDDELQVVEISKIIAAETCNRDEICTAVFAGRDPQDIISMKDAQVKFSRGNAPVPGLVSSEDVNVIAEDAIVEDNPCSQILKSHTPRILELVDPLKFANGLSSVGLLTDGTVDAITTTMGISRYDKASYVVNDISRHLRAFKPTERTKEIETFRKFCEVLKNQHDDLLAEISKEMMDRVDGL